MQIRTNNNYYCFFTATPVHAKAAQCFTHIVCVVILSFAIFLSSKRVRISLRMVENASSYHIIEKCILCYYILSQELSNSGSETKFLL
jgi:hypothetical protein